MALRVPFVLFLLFGKSLTVTNVLARLAQPGAITLRAAMQRYFEVALYLLVLTGFGTLASTGGLDLPTALLAGAAVLFRGYLLATRRSFLIPERWTTGLTLAYAAFYLLDYFFISGGFLNATIHLVIFALVVRLFSARRDRDHYFLAAIAFLMVLAAALLTVGSMFLLTFSGFMIVAVVAVILMEMRHAAAKSTVHAGESRDEFAHRHLAFSLAGASPLLVLLILLGAAGIFFLLPRISAGYFSAYAPGGELTIGFSDRVQLGQIGRIQQSRSVVMHIQIDGDERGGFDLKWRGGTFSYFDGRDWLNPEKNPPIIRSENGRFQLRGQAGDLSQTAKSIHYRVLMEPVGANVFFLVPLAQVLEGSYKAISLGHSGGVSNLDAEHPVARYEATSNVWQPDPQELRATTEDYPFDVTQNYLQLPALDPRIAQLAEQITATSVNRYDKTAALEGYLRTKLGYTLQLPTTPQPDPLANFLFERKQGHCEYFASAMAVMLRTLRIPARVAAGFRGREFNDVSSQYVVRASDAHAWVEVYFPGYGWVEFDPTPAGSNPVPTGWDRAMLYVDAMASFWREWVVNYDLGHQQTLALVARHNSREWLENFRKWRERKYDSLLNAVRRAHRAMTESPSRWNWRVALLLTLLILGANASRLWRMFSKRQLAAHPEMYPGKSATIWYERMTRRLRRRGWHKSPEQTPAEFTRRIDEPSVQQRVAEFTRNYERARFGDSAEAAQHLPELYEAVLSATRLR
jgi:protein-glutamine gamma-glutamyltransferase